MTKELKPLREAVATLAVSIDIQRYETKRDIKISREDVGSLVNNINTSSERIMTAEIDLVITPFDDRSYALELFNGDFGNRYAAMADETIARLFGWYGRYNELQKVPEAIKKAIEEVGYENIPVSKSPKRALYVDVIEEAKKRVDEYYAAGMRRIEQQWKG